MLRRLFGGSDCASSKFSCAQSALPTLPLGYPWSLGNFAGAWVHCGASPTHSTLQATGPNHCRLGFVSMCWTPSGSTSGAIGLRSRSSDACPWHLVLPKSWMLQCGSHVSLIYFRRLVPMPLESMPAKTRESGAKAALATGCTLSTIWYWQPVAGWMATPSAVACLTPPNRSRPDHCRDRRHPPPVPTWGHAHLYALRPASGLRPQPLTPSKRRRPPRPH